VRCDVLATATKARVFDKFAAYGTELVDFLIEAITPPDEVQTRIDERSGIGAIGDLDSYLRYKSALALGEAATRPGSAGGALDAAVAWDWHVPPAQRSGGTDDACSRCPAVRGVPASILCLSCSQTAPGGSSFCPQCGKSLVANLCTNRDTASRLHPVTAIDRRSLSTSVTCTYL
jgi:membrane protease subunit (stomatin/prohibitin family)